MAEQSDRVVIKFGPGRLDADKSIQRELDTLREEVETKTTIPPGTYPTVDEVEDIVGDVISQIDVINVSPQFIGVPPGLQQFYFAAVVVEDTINMDDTVKIAETNRAFAQDYGNTLGAGANAVASIRDSTTLAIYNFGNSFAGIKSFSSTIPGSIVDGFRAGETFSVLSIYQTNVVSTGFPFVVFQNGTYSSITLARPSGYGYILGTGISSDGNYICSVWAASLTTGSNDTCVIVTHNLNGTINEVGNPFTLFASNGRTIIDNGWIVHTNGYGRVSTAIATSSTEISNPLTLVVVAPSSSSLPNYSQNISRDGTYYFIDEGDLYKLDVPTGLVSIYPDVISRYDNSFDPPVYISAVEVVSVHSASSTTMAFGGRITITDEFSNSARYPIFSLVTLEETGAAISDTLFAQFPYTGTQTAQYPRVYDITSLENGRFVYAMDAGGSYPTYILNVAGPTQAP